MDTSNFYDKTESDTRFIDTDDTALNASNLDNLDSTAFQRRVTGTCVDAGIGSIAANGTVECATYVAGLVAPGGTKYFGSDKYTVSKTATGTYEVLVPIGIFANGNLVPVVSTVLSGTEPRIATYGLGGANAMRIVVETYAANTNTKADSYFTFYVFAAS